MSQEKLFHRNHLNVLRAFNRCGKHKKSVGLSWKNTCLVQKVTGQAPPLPGTPGPVKQSHLAFPHSSDDRAKGRGSDLHMSRRQGQGPCTADALPGGGGGAGVGQTAVGRGGTGGHAAFSGTRLERQRRIAASLHFPSSSGRPGSEWRVENKIIHVMLNSNFWTYVEAPSVIYSRLKSQMQAQYTLEHL